MMLELGYIALQITLIGVFIYYLNKAFISQKVEPRKRKVNFVLFIGVLAAWFVIQYLVNQTGFYNNLSMPPRIVLCMILPLFVFTGVFLFIKRKSSVLHAIPIHIPILYQSFRAVIEMLFYFSFLRELVPVHVTFEGYNMDILLGISALPMAFYATRDYASEKILIAWNLIGIIVVAGAAFIFVTTNYFPEIWGFEKSIFPSDFVKFPFLFLPSFLMPSAIFVHVLSIIQLTKK